MRDPKYLHPKLQIIHKEFVRRCAKKGIKILTYVTRRSLEEQAELYAKGRTKPGKKVTNAKPGYSWHNFDLAFDCVEIKNGKCLWSNPNWKIIGKIGVELDLIWGGNFKSITDKPHFEYHPGLTLSKARELHAKGEDLLGHVPTPDFSMVLHQEQEELKKQKIREQKAKAAVKKKEENIIQADFKLESKVAKIHPILLTVINFIKGIISK